MDELKQLTLQARPNIFQQKHGQHVLVMDPTVNLSNKVITVAFTKGIRYWGLT